MKKFLSWLLPASAQEKLYNLLCKVLGNYYLLPKSRVMYSHDLLYTYHNADFVHDKRFAESYKLGKETDKDLLLQNYDIEWRVHTVLWAASQAMHLDGDFVDCGVHTGIYARAIVNYVDFQKSKKTYFLLDTFEGLSEKFSTEEELKRNEKMHYEKRGDIYKQVQATFKPFKNVQIIKGAVPDTLPLVKSNKIAFLSIDMNCVQPEVDALEFFWDKMVSGGMILLDDYGYANSTNDQRAAHQAFAKSKGIEILSLPTCQGLIVKP